MTPEIAAREVAAARAAGVYAATWHTMQRQFKRDERARALILKHLAEKGEMTTRMIARHLSGAADATWSILAKMEDEGQVKSRIQRPRKVFVDGRSQTVRTAYWRLAE